MRGLHCVTLLTLLVRSVTHQRSDYRKHGSVHAQWGVLPSTLADGEAVDKVIGHTSWRQVNFGRTVIVLNARRRGKEENPITKEQMIDFSLLTCRCCRQSGGVCAMSRWRVFSDGCSLGWSPIRPEGSISIPTVCCWLLSIPAYSIYRKSDATCQSWKALSSLLAWYSHIERCLTADFPTLPRLA